MLTRFKLRISSCYNKPLIISEISSNFYIVMLIGFYHKACKDTIITSITLVSAPSFNSDDMGKPPKKASNNKSIQTRMMYFQLVLCYQKGFILD
jgi:hypothetical protein